MKKLIRNLSLVEFTIMGILIYMIGFPHMLILFSLLNIIFDTDRYSLLFLINSLGICIFGYNITIFSNFIVFCYYICYNYDAIMQHYKMLKELNNELKYASFLDIIYHNNKQIQSKKNKFKQNYDAGTQKVIKFMKKKVFDSNIKHSDIKSLGSISVDSTDNLVKELNNELKYASFLDIIYHNNKQIQSKKNKQNQHKISKKNKQRCIKHLHHQDNIFFLI